MTSTHFTVEGKTLSLGKRIGKGGEGEVYALNDGTGRAFKCYTVADTSAREAKIKAMIKSRMAETSDLVAFPLAIAHNKHGQFAGFLMNLVNNHKPLFELYAPGARKQNFPQADYRFLVRAAANVARAVASVHKTKCVIGDINHSGILISEKATAALIDADSFQIIDGLDQYLCRVGVPEYTPPELQGQKLSGLIRTPNHDDFGLAVVIFQLLFMGRHPFMGAHNKGDMPIERAIREYRFAYSEQRQVGMTPPPGAPLLSDFPASTRTGFEMAFSDSKATRPSAEHWIAILEELEKSLRQCSSNKLHYFSSASKICSWCTMEQRLGMVLFIPYWSASDPKTLADPGAERFDIRTVWAAIEAVSIPISTDFSPVLPNVLFKPSPEAQKEKTTARGGWITGAGVLTLSLILLACVPTYWFFWLILGYYGGSKIFSKAEQGKDFLRQYANCERAWANAIDDWRGKLGLSEIEQLKKSLISARLEYERLPAQREQRLAQHQSERRIRHLNEFLERYQIRQAKIKGVGPAKQTALTSYGIETAADVTYEKVLCVPGFGPTNSTPLLDWRAEVESKFRYDNRPTSADQRERETIELDLSHKASSLRKALMAGAKDLANAVTVTQRLASTQDHNLVKIHRERIQLEHDLAFLGIAVPSWSPRGIATSKVSNVSSGAPMSERTVSGFFGATYAQRGNAYERRGMVINATFDRSSCIATGEVNGSRSVPYQTTIVLNSSKTNIESAKCSCPMSTVCKHGAAVMYHLIRTGRI